MSLAPRPRPNGGNAHAQDVVIDLTSDSDSPSDLFPGLNDSDIDSDEDLFVPEVRAPPRLPAQPQYQPQGPRRPPPQQQLVVIDTPSPEPEIILRRPAHPSAHLPVQRPQLQLRDISSSPEFQAGRPARVARDSPSPLFRDPERFPPARYQNLYDSEDDSDSPVPVRRPTPGEKPAPNARQDIMGESRQGIMGDYVQDDEFDEAMMARIMGQFGEVEQNANAAVLQQMQGFQPPANPRRSADIISMESQEECIENVITIFPGICEEYVGEIYNTVSKSSDRLIAYILDKIEKGAAYPSARDKQKVLKRKRDLDEDEEAVRKYGSLDRVIPAVGGGQGVRPLINTILTQEFKDIPASFINAALAQSGFRLFSTYRVLEEAQRTWDPTAPTYQKLKKNRATNEFRDENLPVKLVEFANDQLRKEVIEELIAARRIRRKADQKRLEVQQAELAEEENTRKAELEGTMSECGCCMGDYPLNRMVHCDNDEMHWFCRGCALKTAETEIENARYEIKCMSMDGCEGGFSLEQRSQFLDANTIIALERNEQESNLRMAGIENLESCPFCPYAAEYPPIEINRLFECQRPDCEKVSCRLCKLESHIPKTCEENAKENGLSVRRLIEEAMSAALIRTCNKCQTPFIKEEGCNKMTCTRPGCHNIQCYVCSKSCGYDHFNDVSRGGKLENCPLFEKTDDRHDKEVKDAEKAAMDKVRADHPEYTEEDLRVKVSDEVQADDARRRANDPQARLQARMAEMRAIHGAGGMPGARLGQNFREMMRVRVRARPPHPNIARRDPNIVIPPGLVPDPGVPAQNYPDPADVPMINEWMFDQEDEFDDFDDEGDDVMALFHDPALFRVNRAPAQQAHPQAQGHVGVPNNQINNLQEPRQQLAAQVRLLQQQQQQRARQLQAGFMAAHNIRAIHHHPVVYNAPIYNPANFDPAVAENHLLRQAAALQAPRVPAPIRHIQAPIPQGDGLVPQGFAAGERYQHRGAIFAAGVNRQEQADRGIPPLQLHQEDNAHNGGLAYDEFGRPRWMQPRAVAVPNNAPPGGRQNAAALVVPVRPGPLRAGYQALRAEVNHVGRRIQRRQDRDVAAAHDVAVAHQGAVLPPNNRNNPRRKPGMN